MRAPGLDHLWTAAPSTTATFQPETLNDRPEPAQRLLRRAIAAGSPAASAVRLRMQGQIKLRQWCPFSAEEVIAWDRGFMWAATARVRGMPITGSDRLVRGEGMMR
jgi:hypothetical protein